MGCSLYAQGKIEASAKSHGEALRIRRSLFPGRPHPHIATSLSNLANAMCRLKQLEVAAELFDEAISVWDQLRDGKPRADLAVTLSSAAFVHAEMGKFEHAAVC